ncbi:hypothetical protein CVT24_004723 [Panaeolus cyanescens]|uniref:DUF6532 domain-containing protein n=1 Tax=Panaeolus cyanescens TaxID=181874 RepID=A0A409YSM1_9AGAR|nr:hypothetical protein CVT24_004723 [Panaeolus cyanescens]
MSSPSDGRVHKTRSLQKKSANTTAEKAAGRSNRKAKEAAVKKLVTTESTKKRGDKRRNNRDTDGEEDGGQDERPKKKSKPAKTSGQIQKRVASRRQVIQSEDEVTASDADTVSSEASDSDDESSSPSIANAHDENTAGSEDDDDDDDEKEDETDKELGDLFDSEMPYDISDAELPSRVFEDTLDTTEADGSPNPSSKKTKVMFNAIYCRIHLPTHITFQADIAFNNERPLSVTTHKMLSKSDKKKSKKADIQASKKITQSSSEDLKSESSLSSSDTIRAQSPEVQQVIQEGILLVEKDLLTVHAWPEHLKTEAYRRRILRKAAKAWAHKSPRYASLKEQIEVDPSMVRLMGKLVLGRLPSHRNRFYTEAGRGGLAPFRLGVGEECAARVAALLAGHVYVYPGKWNINEVRMPDGSVVEKPIWVPVEYTNSGDKQIGQGYLNHAICCIITDAMFGERDNWGHRHRSLFKASNPNYPDEPEAPVSLIALAATALYAALNSWTHGTPTKGRFSGDAYRAVFKRHMEQLMLWKDIAPNTFHHITHTIYKKVIPNDGTLAGGQDSGPLLTIDVSSLD